ncbi:MAG: hypothetical protein IKZ91_03520 [Bacteroidales bacterium]|nr:hypothetical protein [Bacteroidales bacterium]
MEEASVSIRLNPFKGSDGPAGSPVPWSPHGRILSERPQFILDPLMHAGCYYVQDSSAMFVGHLFRKMLDGFGPGVRVLDLCAAPGGKTTDIATSLRERFGGGFTVVANEVMKARAAVLSDNVAVWGDPNVAVTSVDPAVLGRALPGCFDIIVADVPCSGEGMFRKDKRAVEEWSPELVTICAARQKRILADVWPALREGGILVYSTCTYEDAENDSNLEWAASELGGNIVPPEDEFPGSGIELTRCGSLLRAGVVPGEGQWAGAMVKASGSERSSIFDLSVLRPLRNGTPAPTLKGRDLIPHPDSVLDIDFDKSSIPAAEVDLRTALSFLHRDSIVLPDAPLGYNVITYNGHPLGLVKNLGRRCNNLHPLSRRILKDIDR